MVMESREMICERSSKFINSEKELEFECLLFDLDDTLYPLSTGIAQSCRENIEAFMIEKLGFDSTTSKELCAKFYKENGTTMAGLVLQGYRIDPNDYHSYVHGRLPYHLLRPDPLLRNLLLSMPQRKLIFTNADIRHAIKVLRILGLEDCFEGIICFETIMAYTNIENGMIENYELDNGLEYPPTGSFSDNKMKDLPIKPVICKPSMEAMDRAIALAGADPSKTLFFDDSARNIAAGKRSGLHTVLVGSSVKVEGADYAIGSIHNMREAIPTIWESEENIFSPNTVPMEAVVVNA